MLESVRKIIIVTTGIVLIVSLYKEWRDVHTDNSQELYNRAAGF